MAACKHPYCTRIAPRAGAACDICMKYEPGGSLEEFARRPGGCACTASTYYAVSATEAPLREAIRAVHDHFEQKYGPPPAVRIEGM